MGGVEGRNLGSGGVVPGNICKRVTQDSLFRTDNVTPAGVEMFLVPNTQFWSPLCATGGVIERNFFLDLLGDNR